ncbi:hypothetical protein Gohar_000947, partial [Gossypium harknessii]|nr:hypothetical protein [Gossypium harknessii]
MSLADTLAHSPLLLFVALFEPRAMPIAHSTGFGRRRKPKSDSS